MDLLTTPGIPNETKIIPQPRSDGSIVYSWWFWVGIAIIVILLVLIIVLISFAFQSKNTLVATNKSPSQDCDERVGVYYIMNRGSLLHVSRNRPNMRDVGEPLLYLCTKPGPNRIPLFKYQRNDDVIYGTTEIPPSKYKIANDGLPLGYLSSVAIVNGRKLLPVYENSSIDNKHHIISNKMEPIINGTRYRTTSNIPLGYSF